MTSPFDNDMDLALVKRLGARRHKALATADDALDEIAAEIERVRALGQRVNVAAVARTAGCTRSALYDRLAARSVRSR